MTRRLAIGGALYAIGALALHAILIEIARLTGGVAALLAPSAAASVAGLLTALALLGMRVFVFVVLPALLAAFLVFLATSNLFAAWRKARGPAQRRP